MLSLLSGLMVLQRRAVLGVLNCSRTGPVADSGQPTALVRSDKISRPWTEGGWGRGRCPTLAVALQGCSHSTNITHALIIGQAKINACVDFLIHFCGSGVMVIIAAVKKVRKNMLTVKEVAERLG